MNKDLAYVHIHDSESEVNIHTLPEMSSIHPVFNFFKYYYQMGTSQLRSYTTSLLIMLA